jgi:hypothetical protein
VREMEIKDLQNGQVVRARKGRPGRENVCWEPWHDVQLYVQRTSGGEICVITFADGSWAEYDPQDFDPTYGIFLVEDYYLEIQGLGKRCPTGYTPACHDNQDCNCVSRGSFSSENVVCFDSVPKHA